MFRTRCSHKDSVLESQQACCALLLENVVLVCSNMRHSQNFVLVQVVQHSGSRVIFTASVSQADEMLAQAQHLMHEHVYF